MDFLKFGGETMRTVKRVYFFFFGGGGVRHPGNPGLVRFMCSICVAHQPFNTYSAGTNFSRQNLHLKSILHCKNENISNCHRPIT